MAKKKRKSVYSGIGGQAVLEGVMMRNKDEYAVAIRKPDGGIDVTVKQLNYNPKNIFRKLPFIRGILVFWESLTLGMDLITYSASFYEDEEPEKKGLAEKVFGDKAETVVTACSVFFSVAMALLLFMVLPYAASELLGRFLPNATLILVSEGVLRILIFLIYVAAIALMPDIRRLYQYHGAEHKCINCVESGRPLTVKNAKKVSRFHKRCGTSFMVITILLGVVLCFFIKVETVWMRLLLRLALVPVIAGISYELIRLAGSGDNIILDIVSAPGIWMQHITTKEPDDEMLEVAIASVEAVYDWESFQRKNFKTKTVKKTRQEADGSIVETGDETLEINVLEVEERLAMERAYANGGAYDDGYGSDASYGNSSTYADDGTYAGGTTGYDNGYGNDGAYDDGTAGYDGSYGNEESYGNGGYADDGAYDDGTAGYDGSYGNEGTYGNGGYADDGTYDDGTAGYNDGYSYDEEGAYESYPQSRRDRRRS